MKYMAYISAMLFGLFIIVMMVRGHLSAFIEWIRWTFQNKDGKPCSKRITQFVFTALFLWAAYKFFTIITDPEYLFKGLCLIGGLILLMSGVVTTQNLIALRNGSNVKVKITDIARNEPGTGEETT